MGQIEISYHLGETVPELSSILSIDLPMWCDFHYLPVAELHSIVLARTGNRIIGFWIIPISIVNEKIRAVRSCRYHPYASPWIPERSNIKRRHIFEAMLVVVQQHVECIELPMSPDFKDVPAAVACGCFVEWRHTHRFYIADNYIQAFSPKIRGAITAAQRGVKVRLLQSANDFSFDRAIKGATIEVIEKRRALAIALQKLGHGIVLQAYSSNDVVLGEAFVTFDDTTAYYYHSWYEREGPRGVPSLLIKSALDWSFHQPNLTCFDFEGSIIASVDHFMTAFGANITPYAYLYWSREESEMCEMLMNSINIIGRKILP